MARASFVNPANGDTYLWHHNPETAEDRGKGRQISGSANTGLTGRVRQQGDAGSMVLKYQVRVRKAAMRAALWAWYQLCATQTVHYHDHDGAVYEVQITDLQEKPVRRERMVALDPGMPQHYYEMTVTMEVYNFVSGPLADAGLTP